MFTFFESGQMIVNEVHELVDLFSDSDFLVGFDCESFFDLVNEPIPNFH